MYLRTVLQLLVIPLVLSAEEPPTLQDPQSLQNPPALEDTPASNDTPILEDTKNSTSSEDRKALDDSPSLEEDPPNSDDSESLEDAQVPKNSTSVEDPPSLEDPTTLNDSPSLEDAQVPQNSSSVEDPPSLEDTPTLVDSESLEDAPASENSTASEDPTSLNDVTSSKDTLSSNDTLSLRNSSASGEPGDKPEKDLVRPRIYGGQAISVQELGGFAVQIYRGDSFTCTGSVLSMYHVLSAAHCFEDAGNIGEFHVVAGESYRSSYLFPGERNHVVRALIHPFYDKYSFIGDMAVLKVRNPLQGFGVRPIAICSRILTAGMMVTIAGWGRSEYGDSDDALRKIVVPLVSKDECNDELGQYLPDNVICAAGYNYKTICNGDSGGPLIHDNEVCGISIWTYGCGNNVKPDIFMSVYMYRNFIEEGMSM